ncbi:hypothetical protein [Spirosoma telluris]|uniref:hypothetical protein n=1 Tax=Spirosoma telluris TaxID=2183553 RepID=UPI002FC30EAB
MSKVFSVLTPLVGVSLIGVIMILYGFIDMKQENNILQFLFGIPIAGGALGFIFWFADSLIRIHCMSGS